MSIDGTQVMTAAKMMILPESLQILAEQRIASFCERHEQAGSWLAESMAADKCFASQLSFMWACSPFVFETCLSWPDEFRQLVASGDLCISRAGADYQAQLAAALDAITTEAELHKVLRQFRRREMMRILWRDFTRQAPMLETTADVTCLAEACIQQALAFLCPIVEQQMGTPIGKYSGDSQQMVVLGMGKMGAWELNVSSDIDLIFAFPEAGETIGSKRQYSNQEFFLKLAQKLIQALDQQTIDGFVFRVDMRLRPYGESGAMVLNYDAMEEYYHSQGRDWERYAMIKARVVSGDTQAGNGLMQILRPFTYRKYIDFSVIQSLRDMKTLINREVARLGAADDVKKGAGGIREIEFIAQAFQLIRGGKDKHFQNPSLKHILDLLETEQLLPTGEPGRLWDAYVFLRNTEHVLQGYKDKQTQLLPDTDEGRVVVATVMGHHNWDGFYAELEQHRQAVKTVFAGIAAETSEEQQQTDLNAMANSLWLGSGEKADFVTDLQEMGFENADELANLLFTLRQSRTVKGLTAVASSRLDKFIPLLLTLCQESTAGHLALQRILPLIEAILRRSAYLVLMLENPSALRQLVYLCSESSWIAEQISRYPALLDELLDSRTLYTAQDKNAIRQEMRQDMLRIPGSDLEAQMEALRYFRRAQALRIAACEVEEVLPLMKVSDNLTWLAEVIVEQVLVLAWDWVTAKYGLPGKQDEDERPGLSVLGYGKLGGLELGHNSDLDLVFLHDANPNLYTDGEKSIDNNTFFMRLCQRMIHILSTQTPGGDLYEVDARLRPNGNSGMLVTSLTAFEKYQHQDAWTWEHQALVRARPVAGSDGIAEGFEKIRRAVLSKPRDQAGLLKDVLEMREKMRSHLGSKSGAAEGEPQFHLKQDAGGIVDIEFLVQFHVLKYASEYPDLLTYSDNMRILEIIEQHSILDSDAVACLQEAYVNYRTLGHRLSLQGAGNTINPDDYPALTPLRQGVSAIWQRCMLDASQ